MTLHIIEPSATTNEDVGGAPDARTVEQRLAAGFILLDKPAGPTSHQIAAWARDLFGLERLGHGGTLDPFATGVLPLMAGKAMKLTKKKFSTTRNRTSACSDSQRKWTKLSWLKR